MWPRNPPGIGGSKLLLAVLPLLLVTACTSARTATIPPTSLPARPPPSDCASSCGLLGLRAAGLLVLSHERSGCLCLSATVPAAGQDVPSSSPSVAKSVQRAARDRCIDIGIGDSTLGDELDDEADDLLDQRLELDREQLDQQTVDSMDDPFDAGPTSGVP